MNMYWCSENPRAVHEVPSLDSKVGVWCGVVARKSIGALFFDERRFDNYVLIPFLRELTVEWRRSFVMQEVPRCTQISRCTGREIWRTADNARFVASWGLVSVFFVADLFFVVFIYFVCFLSFFVEVAWGSFLAVIWFLMFLFFFVCEFVFL